jgi:surface antigen
MRKFLIMMVAAIGLSGATPAYADGTGETFGTLVGAGVGGLIGNQFGHGPGRVAATAAGVIGGGLIGNSIGSSIDEQNRYYGASDYAPYNPQPVYFTTNYVPNYVAPPAPTPESIAYYDESVQAYCREYTQNVDVNGGVEESYGTVCLQPDGTWRVVQ